MLLAVPVTVALALAVTQLLAVGMTSPLREMTEATRRMARGDYRGRVRADSSDEIGELARAFNQMAAELATVDSEQRNLVATVSHELRTPLAALTATLENLADGVRPADAEHLGRAVDQAQRIGALVGDLLELSRRRGRRGTAAARPGAGRSPGRRGRGRPRADRPGRAVRRRHTRVARGAGRPHPAPPAAHQRARQRGPAQPRGRPGAGHLRRHPRPVAAGRGRRGAGGRTRRPGARVRAVRHAGRPRRGRGHRRDRAGPRHRALGGDPAQRRDQVRRSAGRHVRRAAPRRPALEPACSSVRPDPPGDSRAHHADPAHPARPAAATRRPSTPATRARRSSRRRSSIRCSAGSGRTCRAAAEPSSWPRPGWASWPGWCCRTTPRGWPCSSWSWRPGSRWRTPRDTRATRSP